MQTEAYIVVDQKPNTEEDTSQGKIGTEKNQHYVEKVLSAAITVGACAHTGKGGYARAERGGGAWEGSGGV